MAVIHYVFWGAIWSPVLDNGLLPFLAVWLVTAWGSQMIAEAMRKD